MDRVELLLRICGVLSSAVMAAGFVLLVISLVM